LRGKAETTGGKHIFLGCQKTYLRRSLGEDFSKSPFFLRTREGRVGKFML